ncbi:hypothetical protein ACFY5H_26450 [Streptomyces sp. NPDC013012]|uniref:hypothetical protein n=1 Tax=Streptomyces sp. NPDC013012 TaxID=3364860 RepID=UPI003699F867
MADRFRIEHEGSSGSELEATDRLDVDEALGADEREALLDRVRTHRQVTAEVEKLRVQLARAEAFEGTLRRRLPTSAPASGS